VQREECEYGLLVRPAQIHRIAVDDRRRRPEETDLDISGHHNTQRSSALQAHSSGAATCMIYLGAFWTHRGETSHGWWSPQW
jgi:hypothetical protein